MKYIIRRLIFVLLLLSSGQAEAWTHGFAGAAGNSQINVGLGELIPKNFINVMKMGRLTLNSMSIADIAKLDAEGYLTATPAASVSVAFPSGAWATQYKLVWSGSQFKLFANMTVSSCTGASNVTVTGCSSGTATFTTTAASGSVTFTTASDFNLQFINSGTYSHTLGGEIAIYRVSDEAAYQAGLYFTPEFESVLQNLRLQTIRPMQWVQKGSSNYNSETQWRYRVPTSALTWRNGEGWIAPGAWGGNLTRSVPGAEVFTATNPPDGTSSWVDGEVIISYATDTNTTTAPELAAAGKAGTKTIVRSDASVMTVGYLKANQVATFVYDGLLDKAIYAGGIANSGAGLLASIPIEAQVQLANRINANLWAVLPPMASDDYVTNWATKIRDTLRGGLYFYSEYSNEVWNSGFPQTGWSSARGLALGFTASANRPVYGWYGLRVRQIMGNLIPAVFVGQMSRVRRVLAYQAAGDSTNVTYRFNGTDLVPGNAAYNAYTSSANYSVFPNRPIDGADTLSYADYVAGANLCQGPDFGCTPTSANTTFYQTMVTNWEGGDTASAIQAVDDDIRTGRTLTQSVTASGTTFTTPLAHGFTANSTPVSFQVTGGTIYSGVAASTLYRVTSTPTSTTFTMQPYVGGFPTGSNVSAGSVGSGTMTIGANIWTNLVYIASTYYKFGEANAALYDSARNGAGMALLRVELYEGNLEPKGLSSAQCTTLGITGSDCTGSIAAAVLAWKNNTLSNSTQQAFYKQFMGTDSAMPPTFGLMTHSQTPSQFVLMCDVNYQLLATCSPDAAPYQLYYGINIFNGG